MQKKIFNIKCLCCIAIFSFILSSCKKESNQGGNPIVPVLPSIYAAGYITSGGSDYRAFSWINGNKKPLNTSFNSNSTITDMFVSGSDVYIVGHATTNSVFVAKIWKNGVETNLSNSINHNYANAVFVSGNDVYVAGTEESISFPFKRTAKCWKNGVPTNLTNGFFNNFANDIYVKDNNVYVVGFENDGVKSGAKIWTNGVETNLNIGFGRAESVEVDKNNNVYVLTYLLDGSGSSQIRVVLFKNGIPINITDGTYITFAFDLKIYNDDIYILGHQTIISGSSYARYWKNGVMHDINNLKNVPVYKIFVHNNDVYTCGSTGITTSGGFRNAAIIWKNGNQNIIDSSDGAAVTALFIK